MGVRELISEKPWLGWVVAGALAILASVLLMRVVTGTGPRARLSETVTVKCIETGDEWEMNRGMMELELLRKSATGPLDPSEGLLNPNTGRPTGFPFEKSRWESLVARINADRAAANKSLGSQASPQIPEGVPQRSVPNPDAGGG